MENEDYDVIIIGAGPSGSLTAAEIAKKGWNVLLVEKNTIPGRGKPCGGLFSAKAAAEFGIEEGIIEKRISKDIYHFPWFSREKLVENVIVVRSKFDAYLAERAKSCGSKILSESRVKNIIFKKPGLVNLTIKRKENVYLETTCKIVIFADGYHTLANETCGIGYERQSGEAGFAYLYELEYRNNTIGHCEIYFGDPVSLWGYGWMFPQNDTINVGIGCVKNELKHNHNLQQKLEHFISQNLTVSGSLSRKKVICRKGAFLPLKPAKKFSTNSALVVGDAAGLVHPLFGAGIDNALYSAQIATQVVNSSLHRKDYSSLMLNDYDKKLKNANFFKFLAKQNLAIRIFQRLNRLDCSIFPRLMNVIIFGENVSFFKKVLSLFSTRIMLKTIAP